MSDEQPRYNPDDPYFHYRNLINGFPDTIVRLYIEKAINEAFLHGRDFERELTKTCV
jgi:hypothetical protein